MESFRVEYLIRKSKTQDILVVKEILSDSHLPIDGVEDQFENFLIISDKISNEIIGSIGVEKYNNFGLLRSVVIKKEYRNLHLGSQILLQAEQLALELNISELYLLTETAAKFFSKNDYNKVERDLAPLEIQNSPEFKFICRDSGILMKKVLT
jgi:amino-acid N-acetyltransferase